MTNELPATPKTTKLSAMKARAGATLRKYPKTTEVTAYVVGCAAIITAAVAVGSAIQKRIGTSEEVTTED